MSEVPQNAWFYTKEGERIGPLTFGDLKLRVTEGVIHPRTDMVWTTGMEAWKPAGEIEGLYERRTSESPVQSMSDTPDHLGDSGGAGDDASKRYRNAEWPGFGRAIYFIGSSLLGFASGAVPPLLASFAKGYEQFLIAVPIILIVISIWMAFQRLINVGMSRWWFLGYAVPILNLWVMYRMLVCPAGYAYHKKLGGAGIFLAILFWLSLIASAAGLVVTELVIAGKLGDPKLKKQFEEFNEKAKTYVPAK
jgi:GYF domain 2